MTFLCKEDWPELNPVCKLDVLFGMGITVVVVAAALFFLHKLCGWLADKKLERRMSWRK